MDHQTKISSPYSRKLKICHFSDSHGLHEELVIPQCDVLICSGDISMRGEKEVVESFLSWFSKTPARYRILVAGNHDLTFDRERGGNKGSLPTWIIDYLADFTECGESENNFYLENESCEIEGVKFWGSPTSAWFHGDHWAFNVKEDKAEEVYSQIPYKTDVVITHGPAYTYGDYCIEVKNYVGDHVLERHLHRVKPLLHLFGHIHESYGHSWYPDIHYFNGSVCGLDYRLRGKPWLIDADFEHKEVEILNKIS